VTGEKGMTGTVIYWTAFGTGLLWGRDRHRYACRSRDIEGVKRRLLVGEHATFTPTVSAGGRLRARAMRLEGPEGRGDHADPPEHRGVLGDPAVSDASRGIDDAARELRRVARARRRARKALRRARG
jgi:hypothetical protein